MICSRNRSHGAPSRAASILGLSLLIMTILALLVAIFLDRSTSARRTYAWSSRHLVLRQLADSGAEELYARLQQACAGDSADPVRASLCSLTAAPVSLSLSHSALDQELVALQRSGSGTMRLDTARVTAWMQRPLIAGGDPREILGTARVEVAVSRTDVRPVVTERVLLERPFKVSRVSAVPLPRQALYVSRTEGSLATYLGVPSSDALPLSLQLDVDGARPFAQVLSQRLLQQNPPDVKAMVERESRSYTPAGMAARAVLVFRSAGALQLYVHSQLHAGLPVSGVLHLASTNPGETLTLEFSGDNGTQAFRGRAMITADTPICVQKTLLADPAQGDRLTIASTTRIDVKGRQVQAQLWCLGNQPDNEVRFWQVSAVSGGIYSGQFPRAQGLSAREYARVSFAPSPAGPADPNNDLDYVVAFSPVASSIQHRFD